MRLEEYAQIVGNRLITAYNNEGMRAFEAEREEANQTLESNHASPVRRWEFWKEVWEVVASSTQLRRERQSNDHVIALMRAIEKEIVEQANMQLTEKEIEGRKNI